jgi:membrane peptidoglycan carboxypeptidase
MASAPRGTSRAVNPAQFLALLLAFVLLASGAGVLAAGLVMPAVAAVGGTTQTGVKIFDQLPDELALDPPSEQSVMLASDGSLLARFYAENRIVVPLDAVSPYMRAAVIAVEDKRFYEHGGIDPEGMLRATVTNLVEGSTQGGSTLTQQYVKNVLIEAGLRSGDPAAIAAATEVSLGRKLREAKLAIALEQQMTKDQILEGYLNIAQFGPSQYGVEVAARYYFGKSAAELNIEQSAMLAGITQSPGRWDPVRNPENALIRRNTVLALMRDQGVITQAEFDAASAVPIADMLNVQPQSQGCQTAGISAYFCDFVIKTIVNDPTYGATEDDRRRLLLRGGLTITTTLDPAKQQLAHDAVVGAIPVNDGSGISNAIVTVEPGTGRILTMAQNSNYGNATPESPRDTLVNWNTDEAYGGSSGFQTGSSFKAFVLTEWLRSGRSLYDRVDATKRLFPRRSWNISCAPENRDDWNPKNAESFASGPMSVLDATRESVNTAYAAMANQLDLCNIRSVAETMGVHTAQGTPLNVNPSMVLGSNTIAPLTMAAAFATYASGGTYCAPVPITSVKDTNGDELPVPASNCQQVLDPQIAAAENYALQQVVSNGTARGSGLGNRPSAGKTGTANEDWHAWFVGYTPQMSTAVWIGHSEGNIPMQRVTINGRYYRYVYGGVLAAPTWARFMRPAHEGLPVVGFAEPDERLLYGDRRQVPNVVGQDLASAQAKLEAAGFATAVGGTVNSQLAEGLVASTSPGAGSRVAPGSTITIFLSGGSGSSGGGGSGGGGDGGGDTSAAAPDGGSPGNSGNAPGRNGG